MKRLLVPALAILSVGFAVHAGCSGDSSGIDGAAGDGGQKDGQAGAGGGAAGAGGGAAGAGGGAAGAGGGAAGAGGGAAGAGGGAAGAGGGAAGAGGGSAGGGGGATDASADGGKQPLGGICTMSSQCDQSDGTAVCCKLPGCTTICGCALEAMCPGGDMFLPCSSGKDCDKYGGGKVCCEDMAGGMTVRYCTKPSGCKGKVIP